MAYGIFESTNITGRNFTFRGDADIENGTLVTRGDQITKDIYKAALPAAGTLATEKVYVVGHPAWSYEEGKTAQNENEFINKAGKDFRTYDLLAGDKYTIADYGIDLGEVGGKAEIGQFVGLAAGSGKPVASEDAPTGSAFVGKIADVKGQGNAYFVGEDVDLRLVKVEIEVVKNG